MSAFRARPALGCQSRLPGSPRPSLFSRRFQVKPYHDVVADQIVSLAGVKDLKIFTVDREVGLDRYFVRRNVDLSRKRHDLFHTVQVEIACNDETTAALRRAGYDRCG